MSFDLLVFDPNLGDRQSEARRLYLRVMDETEPSERVPASAFPFYRAFRDSFPIFDDERSAEFRELLTPRFEMMIVSVGFLFAFTADTDEEVLVVSRIANEHGLAVFDPQSGAVSEPFPPLDASRQWADTVDGRPEPC